MRIIIKTKKTVRILLPTVVGNGADSSQHQDEQAHFT